VSDRQPTESDVLAEFERRLVTGMRTLVPGQVVTFTPATTTRAARVKVQPGQKMRLRNGDEMEIPILPAVPVWYPRGGGLSIEWPLATGDYGWILVADRAIDRWYQQGIPTAPRDGRTHDIGEAIFLPGGFPDPAHGDPPPALGITIRDRATGTLVTVRPGEVEVEGLSIKLGDGATDFVVTATKLAAWLTALNAAWVVVPGDGGAAFKTALTAALGLPGFPASIAATKAKAE